MKICYVDESGGFEPEGSSPSATPLMVILGLILDHRRVQPATAAFLRLKQTYFPHGARASGHLLDYVLDETKATDLRRALRSSRRDDRRHALGFLDRIVSLLEANDARIIGRVWVKEPGAGLNPDSSYAYAIQDLAKHFDHHLSETADVGLVLCDSRLHPQNRQVSHSIFTFKHRVSGDRLPNLVETPTFGVSDNHIGLQLADLLAGAVIFPIACRTYCGGSPVTPHTDPRYDVLKFRYAVRLRRLQHLYRYVGRWKGGIVVSDGRGKRPSSELLRT